MAINTYYFDASDGGPTDIDNVWSNDNNAFDGDTGTYAYTNQLGKDLYAEGTNAPSSSDTITQVRARMFGYTVSGTAVPIGNIYSDGLAELLGTCLKGEYQSWGNYITLDAPSGGWTWAKVQLLEIKIRATESSGGIYVNKIEIEVTSEISSTPTIGVKYPLPAFKRGGSGGASPFES